MVGTRAGHLGGITSTFDPAFDGSGAAFAVATTPISSVTFEGQELSEGATTQRATLSCLAIDAAGRYHAVWYELGQRFELNHPFSTDAGGTWSPIEALSGTHFLSPIPP